MDPIEDRFPRLWAAADRLSVLVLGGLCFWLFCLPLVTVPAAVVALYAMVAPLFAPASGESFGRFWRAFRRSFGTALWLGLLNLVVGLVLYWDVRILWTAGSTWARAISFLFLSLAVVAALVNLYAWPLLAWYPQPLGPLLKRSLLLAAAHPLWALATLAGGAVGLLLLSLLPGWLSALLPLLGPGLFATVTGYGAWQVLRRYALLGEEIAE